MNSHFPISGPIQLESCGKAAQAVASQLHRHKFRLWVKQEPPYVEEKFVCRSMRWRAAGCLHGDMK